MKVSEFLNNNDIPPFLLGAFYGRYEILNSGNFIYTYSSYRNYSKIYDNPALCESSKLTFIGQANEISKPYSFWQLGYPPYSKADIIFTLENDLHLTGDGFFERLNGKILRSAFISANGLTEEKKEFIRGFCELRASLDRIRKLLAMDYVIHGPREADRFLILSNRLNVPGGVINYNPRETQPEYLAGKIRQDQVRFDIYWYAANIGFINEYKTEAFKANFRYSTATQIGHITYFN